MDTSGLKFRKVLDSPDTIFFVLIILLVGFLVYGVTRPVSEPFTELYFDDFRQLPDTTMGQVDFSYVLRNDETADQTYLVKVTADYFGKNNTYRRTQVLGQDSVFVATGKSVVVPSSFNLSVPFEKVRINVSAPAYYQDIHFWVKHVLEEVHYEGYGNGYLDCLPPFGNVPATDEITFSVRGVYAQGWPELTLFINGKKTTRFIVRTDVLENVTFALPSGLNDFAIDLVYENDFRNVTVIGTRNDSMLVVDYILKNVTKNVTQIVNEGGIFVPKTTQVNETIFENVTVNESFIVNVTRAEDRNVFIERVYLGNYELPRAQFLIDQGSGLGFFDCRSVRNGSTALFSPSSFRFRFVRQR